MPEEGIVPKFRIFPMDEKGEFCSYLITRDGTPIARTINYQLAHDFVKMFERGDTNIKRR